MRLYEVLFLIDGGRAAREWEATEGALTGVLTKHGGNVLEKHRFDERKLAYPVNGHRRGTYLLTYVEAEPEAMEEVRADLNLSEHVLRFMFIRVAGGKVPDAARLGTMEPLSDEAIARIKAEREERDARRSGGDSTYTKPAVPKPAAEPKVEADAKPKAEADAEPKAEADAEPKAEADAEPKAEAEAEPKAEAVAEPKTEAAPEPAAEDADEKKEG